MKTLGNFLLKFFGAVFILVLIGLFISYKILFTEEVKYYPVTDDLVKVKLEEWQDKKFGLFMHWGPYSQWGVVESWSICAEDVGWCERSVDDYEQYKSDYEDLKLTFNPVDFNPDLWADAAADAGMGYMVFTTKHHDGFCMFDTKTTDYKITSVEVPFSVDPRADVTSGIFDSFRNKDFMIGAYFSKADWNTPYFWWPNFATPDRNVNYSIEKHPERWEKFVQFTHNQVLELVTNYGKVDILWFDGGWVQPLKGFPAKASSFFTDLYKMAGYTQLNPPQNQDLRMGELAEKTRKVQPSLIFVDRHIEGPEQDYMTPEQFVPDTYLPYPWESCITMAGGWSWSPNANYKPAKAIIHMLTDVVSKGGNLLLNIGPDSSGKWDEEAYSRLEEIGDWMSVNKDAILNTRGREFFGEHNIRYTVNKDETQNVIYLEDEAEEGLPAKITFRLESMKKIKNIRMYGIDKDLVWDKDGKNIIIEIPEDIRKNAPCKYAWAFHIY